MTAIDAREPRSARLVHVTGLVQGVGFRPFVHRLAVRHRLTGWVRNGSGEVEIEIEGDAPSLDAFLAALRIEAPPLARIENLVVDEPGLPSGRADFAILPSAPAADRRQPVSPDVAICPACLAEMLDPADRRHRHPFITCTDCGPRFTVIEAMPYDRERTTMAPFEPCPACRAEYHDPTGRRFHSESNSCPACGPRLWFEAGDEIVDRGFEPALQRGAGLLLRGGILALRGLGGFHLAVDATDPVAVDRLRARKRRLAKPFAVMVRGLEEAVRIGLIGPAETELLESPERPIVLLAKRPEGGLADPVAPGLDRIGVMLASTPLHHLLLALVDRPLVMTSGNLSEEPIAIGNDEARERLGPVADGFLFHDREIVTRCDDSVARVVRGSPVILRRARGYAPAPLPLPIATPVPLVAVGGHLKNTLTLAHGSVAYPSQHLGDLESVETVEQFDEILSRFRALFQIAPVAVARDHHPEYLSSRIAEELELPRVLAVQHHHAHVAAVLAEHGEQGPALGVAFDGTGAGLDGTIWGGEFLEADLRGFRRIGHLRPAPLPGGDLAARTPWRAALGYLSLAPHLRDLFAAAFQGIDPVEVAVAERQIATGLNAPLASSMGRLFDAAAAILGVRRRASYEGQAAMELEALAGRRPARDLPSTLIETGSGLVLDPTWLLAALGAGRIRGEPIADLAANFHAGVAWATSEMVRRLTAGTGLDTVVLSGGVFQNGRLLESVEQRIEGFGLRVLTARRLPPNDGGLSYGQAAIAAAILAAEEEC